MPSSQTNDIGARQPPKTRIVILGGLSALAPGGNFKDRTLCMEGLLIESQERQSGRGMGTNTTAGAERSGSALPSR